MLYNVLGDSMDEYQSQKELFEALKPAFKVKTTLLKKTNYNYIRDIDIWNYLKQYKWSKSINLTISDMVNDIIHINIVDVDHYLKRKIYNEEKKLNTD